MADTATWLTWTAEEVLATNDGATAAEWMAARIEADKAGRLDLVALCIEQAAAAYEAEDGDVDLSEGNDASVHMA